MEYPSKRDWWMTAVCAVLVGSALLTVALAFVTPGGWISALVMIGAAAFTVWVWARTGYPLGERELIARSGPFRWRIPLDAITAVRRTRNPLSSPALSLDRLAIRYGRGGVILISPRDRAAFVRALRARCPAAAIDPSLDGQP
jgi:hypothetical protein